jgi:spoIIIJ-associated protein
MDDNLDTPDGLDGAAVTGDSDDVDAGADIDTDADEGRDAGIGNGDLDDVDLDEAEFDDEPEDDEAEDAELEDDEPQDDASDDGEPEADGDETEFATVASGSSVDEAKVTALAQLRKLIPSVREEEVEFVVLDEGGKGGFLGMGRSHPRVEARVLPGAGAPDPDAPPLDEALDRLHEFLTTVIDGIGLDVEIDVSQVGEALVADVIGEDLGILIGRHGQTLDSLQYLAAIVVNGHSRTRRQVVVDAEGYRGRREVSLKGVADRAAQKAERTRHDVTLKPMTASERKIIHVYLKDNPRVETHSEGDEPQRTVIVSPRRR